MCVCDHYPVGAPSCTLDPSQVFWLMILCLVQVMLKIDPQLFRYEDVLRMVVEVSQ